jgi:2-keto-4-pentenoate hydratase/2-oxohepta-3-ene-1,7-dioic acid hydratase in catechol pathway
MRLLTYGNRGLNRVGIYVGEKVVDLCRLTEKLDRQGLAVGSMRELIEKWEQFGKEFHELQAEAERRIEELSPILMNPDDVSFIAPVPDPSKNVICMGLNYRDHVEEAIRAGGLPKSIAERDQPIFFTKAPSTLIGHKAGIPKHACTNELDYEAELAIIIGRRGKNISQEQVYDHIFGYCCANDISARDLQRRHKQIFKGKTLDGSCPLGPFIVPREDYGDPMNVMVQCWVNGEMRQKASTSMMIHDIPTMIAILSEGFTLEPGDIILTGTPPGVGYARQNPTFLQPGDVVEVEVEGLGRLKNRVIEPNNRSLYTGDNHRNFLRFSGLNQIERIFLLTNRARLYILLPSKSKR